jgi:AcrR family transcriptional regulator
MSDPNGIDAENSAGQDDTVGSQENRASGGTVKADRRVGGPLTADQQKALALLTEGTSIRQAAAALKVNRGTVYRWLKCDPFFRAAYNAWQMEHRESCRAVLMKCAEKAVARIAQRVEFDENLALKVARELGLFSKPQVLATDPARVEREIEFEAKEQEAALLARLSGPAERALPAPGRDKPPARSEADPGLPVNAPRGSQVGRVILSPEEVLRRKEIDRVLTTIG